MAEQTPPAMRPPPGRHPLPREFIARHQRARIIAALAEETVEQGYRAVTVADIVRRAGISRNTFYESFDSKEDCFLAASEFAVKEALRRVVDALAEVIQKDAIGPWLEQPNSGFDGLKPIEVIERGEVDRIWQMIYYLRSGVPS